METVNFPEEEEETVNFPRGWGGEGGGLKTILGAQGTKCS